MPAVGNNAVADGKALDAAPYFCDHADVGIAERYRLIELALHRIERRQQSVGPHLVEHLANLVGLLSSLVEPTCPSEFQQHALGADGHQGVHRSDQKLARTRAGSGNLGHFGGAGLDVLQNLFHRRLPLARLEENVFAIDSAA
jgi:hypothetical protein